MQPRTSAPVDTSEWSGGAMADASRAYPIAFWADACAKPTRVEVDGDDLALEHWLPHLARLLNEAAAASSLYDQRFSSSKTGATVLGGKLEAGVHRYTCDPEAAGRADREALRLARLVFEAATTERVGADRGVRLRIAVVLGGRQRFSYEATASGAGWDQRIFRDLGRRVLADPALWAAIASLP